MSAQEPPSAAQCCHWYLKVGAPVHVPGLPVRRWFGSTAPVIVGLLVFAGASRESTSFAAETATTRPASFFAATAKRSVLPMSSVATVYAVLPVVLRIVRQFAPAASQ